MFGSSLLPLVYINLAFFFLTIISIVVIGVATVIVNIKFAIVIVIVVIATYDANEAQGSPSPPPFWLRKGKHSLPRSHTLPRTPSPLPLVFDSILNMWEPIM